MNICDDCSIKKSIDLMTQEEVGILDLFVIVAMVVDDLST